MRINTVLVLGRGVGAGYVATRPDKEVGPHKSRLLSGRPATFELCSGGGAPPRWRTADARAVALW
jgi:hypothetical protein